LNAPITIDPAALARAFVSKRVPRSEQWRTHFGRSLTPARIESAIRDAADGFMQDLTDAGAETILVDPHLASVLQKRFGQISQVDWDVTPSQVDGIDKQKALDVANVVRSQIAQIPAFRQALHDLAWGHWNGRAALEIHWDRRFTGRAQYQVAELAWVHPRRLTFGPERELRVIDPSWSIGQFREVGLDTRVPCKFVRFVPRLFDEYPERDGLLPRCLYWSNFKRYCARDRMILIELYAKPWKIIEVDHDSNVTAGSPELDDAVDQAEALGGALVAQFAKGLKLRLESPDPKSGDLHNYTIADCDKQISKIVLGATSTTDAQPAGLGSQQARVHQDEQQLIFQADGERIGGVLQRDLVLSIVILNAPFFGISTYDACRYAPKFSLRTAPERDRKLELECTQRMVDLGIAVSVDEVRERTGYRKPEEGEAIIQVLESPQDDMSARYIPPRPMLVDPSGTEPGLGEHGGSGAQPPAAPRKPGAPANDVAQAAPPAAAALEPGSPDEDFELLHGPLGAVVADLSDLAATEPADGLTNFPLVGENKRVSLINSRFRVFPVSVARQLREEYPQIWSKGTPLSKLQFRKLAPVVDRRGVVETDAEDEAVRLREAWAAKHVGDSDVAGVVAQIQWLVIGAQGIERMLRTIGVEKARIREIGPVAAAHAQDAFLLDAKPGYVNGSVEDISDARSRRGAAITTRWAQALSRAVAGRKTAAGVRAALRAASTAIDVRPLALEIERCMLHSAALGAMDADWEANNEEPVAPAAFSVHLAGGQRGFATTPFWEAINAFLSREIVERPVWNRLVGAAKKKAFSIAGLARKSMLEVAFDELGKSITAGKSLDNFSKALSARFEEAGWKKLKPSHVETVFRTATMGAYSSGREVQMTQPAVLKARPYWQILAVKDDRCRATHAKVRGFVLRADDPFWRRVGRPPWGFSCRCKIVSRSEREIKRLGLSVRRGSEISGLPDPGWSSSKSDLL
jgi:SPP1 gp7 family putative phage head morphogenesis protein